MTRVTTRTEDRQPALGHNKRAYGYRCQAVWTGEEMVRIHKLPTTARRQEHLVLVREYADGRVTLAVDGAA